MIVSLAKVTDWAQRNRRSQRREDDDGEKENGVFILWVIRLIKDWENTKMSVFSPEFDYDDF